MKPPCLYYENLYKFVSKYVKMRKREGERPKMTLKKTTALGDITINDSVIARAIINSAAKAGERL